MFIFKFLEFILFGVDGSTVSLGLHCEQSSLTFLIIAVAQRRVLQDDGPIFEPGTYIAPHTRVLRHTQYISFSQDLHRYLTKFIKSNNCSI
jgi:hypothetical protein